LDGFACRRTPARVLIAKEQTHAQPISGYHSNHGRHERTHRSASAIYRRRRWWRCRARGTGIALDQRPAFREYIVRERVPSYAIPDRVVVGGVLPEAGVTYYDVPQSFGATPYRYTVVNGQTVLVEPRTRRIVQVIE
jgi:hypothetical protein